MIRHNIQIRAWNISFITAAVFFFCRKNRRLELKMCLHKIRVWAVVLVIFTYGGFFSLTQRPYAAWGCEDRFWRLLHSHRISHIGEGLWWHFLKRLTVSLKVCVFTVEDAFPRIVSSGIKNCNVNWLKGRRQYEFSTHKGKQNSFSQKKIVINLLKKSRVAVVEWILFTIILFLK